MVRKKKEKNINVMVPNEVHARFKAACASEKVNTTMKEVIVFMMIEFAKTTEEREDNFNLNLLEEKGEVLINETNAKG